MPSLHTTPSRRPSRKSAIPPVTPPGSGETGPVAQMASQPVADCWVDAEVRAAMIAEAAYYCAEKRGFAPGHELEDWLEAEAQIEVALRK